MKQIFTILFTFTILTSSLGQTPEPLILEVEEVSIPGSDEISCHLFCSNFEQIIAFQFSIIWDTLELEFIKVDSFGPSQIFSPTCIFPNYQKGTLPALWINGGEVGEDCVDLEDGSRVVSLRFKRLGGTGKFKIANAPMAIEVLNCNLQILDVIFIDNFGGISHVRNGVITRTTEIESDKITIFPNPANGRIFLKWDHLNQVPDQAFLYTMQGQLIGQRVIADQSIDLPESMISGTYILMLQKAGETVAVKKVQVQK